MKFVPKLTLPSLEKLMPVTFCLVCGNETQDMSVLCPTCEQLRVQALRDIGIATPVRKDLVS